MLLLPGRDLRPIRPVGGLSNLAVGWAGVAGSVSLCSALVRRGHGCSRDQSWCVAVEKDGCGCCWNPESCCNSRRKQIFMIRKSVMLLL